MRHHESCLWPVFWLSLELALTTFAQSVPKKPWSFEHGLPVGVCTKKGNDSASAADGQDGMRALEWSFEPSRVLILPTGPLGNIDAWTGYDGYSRSALGIRIRTTNSGGELTGRSMAGDACGGQFTVPLANGAGITVRLTRLR